MFDPDRPRNRIVMETRTTCYLERDLDRYTDVLLAICVAMGLALAPLYGTWLVAASVSGTVVAAYYLTKFMGKGSILHHYVLAAGLGVFTAQYGQQLNGLFETHFFAFMASTYLVVYRNWRLQIPLMAVVILWHLWGHFHATDALTGGIEHERDTLTLTTILIHACLSACIHVLNAFWAYTFGRSQAAQAEQHQQIGRLEEANRYSRKLLHMKADLRALYDMNKEITDSIRYTQRLQQALLPETALLEQYFAGSFVFSRPHSIVGGDFLWLHPLGREVLVACVDCTGHGVPGAFMTVVATDILNRIAREQPDQPPGIMLEMLDAELTQCMGLEKKGGVADGMDISLCRIDLRSGRILFAGAISPMVLVSEDGMRLIKGSRHCVGGHLVNVRKEFETHEVRFYEGEMLYLFSDGLADQFGGARDKKFTRKGVLDLIERMHHLPLEDQATKVAHAFEEWKGALPQTDDLIVVGIKLRASESAERAQYGAPKHSKNAA